MRRWKLEKYKDGNKHSFKGRIERFGSYKDRATGENIDTVLITDLFIEDDKSVVDHVWIPRKMIKKYDVEAGKIYNFKAKIGTYKRGRTAFDFQLRALSDFSVA